MGKQQQVKSDKNSQNRDKRRKYEKPWEDIRFSKVWGGNTREFWPVYSLHYQKTIQ